MRWVAPPRLPYTSSFTPTFHLLGYDFWNSPELKVPFVKSKDEHPMLLSKILRTRTLVALNKGRGSSPGPSFSLKFFSFFWM